jgi:hypothetical protein
MDNEECTAEIVRDGMARMSKAAIGVLKGVEGPTDWVLAGFEGAAATRY